MTARSVFISHSTKSPREVGSEPAPGADEHEEWTKEEAARRREQVFLDLRKAIVAKIDEHEGYEPWLDDRKLAQGAKWRDSIHEALMRADAAVLLLSPEAVASAWVLKEATVLTVLEAVGFPIAIIPVFLGLRSKEIDELCWGPLKLRDIQAVRVDVGNLMESFGEASYDAAIAAAAGKVVDVLLRRLGEIDGAHQEPDNRFLRWVGVLKGYIVDDRDVIRSLMTDLGLSEASLSNEELLKGLRFAKWASLDPADEARRLVARELLMVDSVTALKALINIQDTDISGKGLAGVFKPAWVNAESATDAPLTARKKKRILVVNARNPKTGEAIIYRAYCNKIAKWRVIAPDEPKDSANPEQVVQSYREAVASEIKGGLPKLPEETSDSDPVFVVIGYQVAGHEDALDAVLGDEDLEPVTFIVMAGAEEDAAEMADRLQVKTIKPPLPNDADNDFAWFVVQLEGIGRRGTG